MALGVPGSGKTVCAGDRGLAESKTLRGRVAVSDETWFDSEQALKLRPSSATPVSSSSITHCSRT